MPQLVNTQSSQIEDIPHEGMQDALNSGKYSLQKGSSVNLLDPSGQLVSVPAEQVKDATTKADFKFPSSQDITSYQNQQQYGNNAANETAAGVFGALRGASAGLSDPLLTGPGGLDMGAAKPPAEMLSGLQQANPDISTASEFGGAIAGSVGATPAGAIARGGQALTEGVLAPAAETAARALVNPESSPVVAKILEAATKTGAHALGSSVEGAAYGLGQSLSENALGDADLNAENILHNVGYGAMFGGALGGTLGLAGEGYKGVKGALSKDLERAALKDSIIENAATAPIQPTAPPASMDELIARNKLGADLGFNTDLPAKNRILETNEILAGDSMFPAHAVQVQSFENPTTRLEYKMLMKSDTPVAKDLIQYEANQKAEGVNKLLPQYIQEIAPEAKVTADPIEGGEQASKSFVDQYEAKKAELRPAFEQIDSVGANLATNPDGLLYKIFSDLPGARDLIGFETREGGGYFLKPYDATTGVSDQTYKQLRNLTRALNKEDLTIGGLRNLRDVMGDKIDFLKAPKEAVQLSNMRRNIMDYMQDEVNKAIPDVKVRDTMKQYAMNEQNREVMEKIFGGSISDKASFGKAIEPEKILDRLFSSRENIVAAKGILGPQFNEIAANYLSHIMNKANDPVKGFSSNNVGKLLRSKNLIMEEALSQNPQQLKKINAVIDKMRGLPDSPPGNPSDTASATNLLKKIQGIGSMLQHPSEIPGKLLGAFGSHIDQNQQMARLNNQLAGKTDEQVIKKQRMYGAYAKIERMGQALGKTIDNHVNKIFDISHVVSGPASKLSPEDRQKKYEKTTQKLKALTADADNFIDKLSSSTEALHEIAPNITGSLHLATSRATQFLASKLPQSEPATPFAEPHKPSVSEMATFNRYHQIVENPMIALQQVKQGTLTKETMETLANVYPKMFQQMQTSIMNKLSEPESKKLPYSTKLMLSMFTGQDLENSLKQQNISSAQQAFTTQGQQAQQPGARQKSAMSKITSANQSQTDVQKVEQS